MCCTWLSLCVDLLKTAFHCVRVLSTTQCCDKLRNETIEIYIIYTYSNLHLFYAVYIPSNTKDTNK